MILDKDIRIGNIVKLNNGSIVKVTKIYKDDIECIDVIYGNIYLVEPEFIFPITFTEKLCRWLGYAKVDDTTYISRTDGYVHTTKYMKYLHEFQNDYEDSRCGVYKMNIDDNVLKNIIDYIL